MVTTQLSVISIRHLSFLIVISSTLADDWPPLSVVIGSIFAEHYAEFSVLFHVYFCCFFFSLFICINHALWLSLLLFFLRIGMTCRSRAISPILAFISLKNEVFYMTCKNTIY